MNAVVIVPDGAPEDEWLDGRAGGVTASEIHDIAHGSRKTWRRILDDKLNGSTFHGNLHTRRGHENEPKLLRAAQYDVPGVVTIQPSSALYGHIILGKHRCTPDGVGLDEGATAFGVEAKHHDTGWVFKGIPAEHMDQMLWGMHVMDLDRWLYVWGVEGVEGVEYRWVERDEDRIEFLIKQANAFIDWRAAGAPELDDIPDEVDDALTDYARGLALASEADALKKGARAVLDGYAKSAAVEGEPLRAGGSRAALFFQSKTVDVLDEDAWAEAEPDTYAEFASMRERVKATEAAAAQLYTKTKTAAPTFRVTKNGASA